ncbi:MAG: hypothetical protein HRU10_10475 [Opitutales bacterium]|nr:hypothetical protein [Opitutales bacterium]
MVASGPSLNIAELNLNLNAKDHVIVCNRGYRIIDSINSSNVIYYFCDENISEDSGLEQIDSSVVKITSYNRVNKELISCGFYFFNENEVILKLLGFLKSPLAMESERSRWNPSGVIEFWGHGFAGFRPYYTVLYSILQFVSSIGYKEIFIYGCDLDYRPGQCENYKAEIYDASDKQDHEGQARASEMRDTLLFAIKQLRRQGSVVRNGSAASPFKF